MSDPEFNTKELTWDEIKAIVRKRDGNTCRLARILSAKDFLILQKNAKYLLTQLDPAHIIARSKSKSLILNPDNVVMLNRFSHEMLDYCKDPITGKPITKEERNNWWIKIVGIDTYTKLLELSKNETP